MASFPAYFKHDFHLNVVIPKENIEAVLVVMFEKVVPSYAFIKDLYMNVLNQGLKVNMIVYREGDIAGTPVEFDLSRMRKGFAKLAKEKPDSFARIIADVYTEDDVDNLFRASVSDQIGLEYTP